MSNTSLAHTRSEHRKKRQLQYTVYRQSPISIMQATFHPTTRLSPSPPNSYIVGCFRWERP